MASTGLKQPNCQPGLQAWALSSVLSFSERRGKLTRQAVNYLLLEIGRRAGLGRVHPHMLRHAWGYALADKGTDFRLMQDFLGHRNPRHTAHYTRTSPARFNKIWD